MISYKRITFEFIVTYVEVKGRFERCQSVTKDQCAKIAQERELQILWRSQDYDYPLGCSIIGVPKYWYELDGGINGLWRNQRVIFNTGPHSRECSRLQVCFCKPSGIRLLRLYDCKTFLEDFPRYINPRKIISLSLSCGFNSFRVTKTLYQNFSHDCVSNLT